MWLDAYLSVTEINNTNLMKIIKIFEYSVKAIYLQL